jgi:hypothetical protein
VWWAADPVDVMIGRDACWVAGMAGSSPSVALFSQLDEALDQVARVSTAQAGLRRWRRRPAIRVWLSAAWARPFVVAPVAGLRRWREALQIAQAQAPEQTGLEGDLKVELEDWPGDHPAVAVAADASVISRIETKAAARKLAVRSIRPWFCRAMGAQSACLEAALVAIEDADALTVFVQIRGHLVLARSYTPRPDGETQAALLTRLALAESIVGTDWLTIPWQPELDLRAPVAGVRIEQPWAGAA